MALTNEALVIKNDHIAWMPWRVVRYVRSVYDLFHTALSK